ncbi:MAG TPA: enolase C-terminal domain-like protein [candidate division Zixibacteria bacterium]|nr:enolase C-terminal domain-like protein [candidate division Zixibacteria bacterium]
MKIVRVEVYPLILPVAEIYGGAAGFLEDCRSLIVRVETEDGIEGWGEATQGRPGNTYETLETLEVMVQRHFAAAVIGMDLRETGRVLARLHGSRAGHPAAKAALETALRDAAARACGVPLYRLLGGPYRTEIDLVGGLGLDLGPQAIAERARELKRRGFRAFKVKIGQEGRETDVDRVAAVREAVGEEAIVRVDGNAAYSFAEARRVLGELGRFRIADAEQPLARGDLRSLAELRRACGIPIAAQESVGSPADALAVVREQAADLFKVKLTHIGGFHRAMQVAAIASAVDLPIVIGQGSACTAILSAAEMHLHAALGNAQSGGEMTGFLRLGEHDLCAPFVLQGGRVALPAGPGLGVSVNKARLVELRERSQRDRRG